MLTTFSLKRVFLLALAASFAVGPAALAQDSKKEESDQAFLSRMQSEMRRIEMWRDNLDSAVQQRMGMATASSNRISINNGGRPSGVGSDPMSGDLRRMRLDLRSMKKEIDKERENMEREFGLRDAEGFDRDHWQMVVRRWDTDLRDMQRDLRDL